MKFAIGLVLGVILGFIGSGTVFVFAALYANGLTAGMPKPVNSAKAVLMP